MASPDPPTPRDPRLIDLALHMVDDEVVDWEEARQTSEDLSETLERLRQIEQVARTHRELTSGSEDAAPVVTWGRLELRDRLGAGGFGEVWRAWDPALQREVALKLRRGEPGGAGESRWLREAQRLARVRHPHVLTVHGTDVHDGRAGIWTDLIRGRTLEQLLLELGPLGAREVVAIGLDVCAALAAVHAAGLVHGDVKTRNIMREGATLGAAGATGAGRIVLMDFGTASERTEDAVGLAAPSAGTPLFAAPELLDDATPTVASDIYGLGVVLYRLASGRFPIDATRMDELRDLHRRHDLTPLRTLRPDLPGALVQVIERALAHDPTARYASAGEMERALAAVFAQAATPARDEAGRWRFATGLLVGALAALAAAFGVVRALDSLAPRFRLAPATQAPRYALSALVPETGHSQLGGTANVRLGDIDHDGHPDLATDAVAEDGTGVVRVLFGDGHGGFPRTVRIHGSEPGELFGGSLAAGDLNGDGIPDLAAGSRTYTLRESGEGRVRVYFGGAPFDTVPGLVLNGPHKNSEFGACVTVGDFNGDGVADLAVGAPAAHGADGQPTGHVYVYYGGRALRTTPDLVLGCEAPNANFGTTVDLGGDLNGDGIADLAVGAQWDGSDGVRAGRTYLFFGGRPPATTPSLVLHSPGAWHLFGPARYVGDIDEDGFDDLVVTDERGDGYEHGSGAAMLFRGSTQPSSAPAMVFKGEHEGDGFGRWVAGIGDVNGDGHPDLAIGAWWSDAGGPTSGAVYVYAGGPRLGTRPLLRIAGAGDGTRFGTALEDAGDLDGDGDDELMIGAPSESRTALGGLFLASFHRYVFTRPRADEHWSAGQPAVVSWEGADPARLEWSADGAHWTTLLAHTGGRAENVMRVPAPAAHGAIRLRLVPLDPHVRGVGLSTPVTVGPAR